MIALENLEISLKPIKDESQYREYLKIIDSLVDCLEGSTEEEVLELISILVEEYEDKHYAIDAPDAMNL